MTQPKSIYPSKMDISYFDEELLDLYWLFVAERQYMYARRFTFDMPRPWTEDSILNSEFITNMYRELDPGTTYVITDILSMPNEVDRLFNVLMYRLMGSQATTHRLIATTAKGFKLPPYMAALETVEKGKLFGDAYRVAGYENFKGSSKHENIGIMFLQVAKQVPEILKMIKAATNVQEVYEVIHGLTGFGDFLAHQITVDLLYKNPRGEAIVPFGDNQWAVAGPGARKGMWALLKPHVKPRSLMIAMEFLRDNQEQGFSSRGVTFPYLADPISGEKMILSLCNIQSTLCEFFKYLRIWDGSSPKVRRYNPSSSANDPAVAAWPLWVPEEFAAPIENRARSLSRLTPPPPIGGRTLPPMAAGPEPAIDPEPPQTDEKADTLDETEGWDNQPAKEPLRAFEGHLLTNPGPGVPAIYINVNVYIGKPPDSEG